MNKKNINPQINILSKFNSSNLLDSVLSAFNLIEHNVSIMDKDLNILWANKAFVNRLGMDMEHVLDEKCYFLWHRIKSPCENCPCIRALQTGNIESFERATKEGRYYILHAIPLKINGEINGVLEIGKEITKEKLVDSKISEVIKLEGIYEMLDNFSHQFNNIFTGIYGFAQLLKNRLDDEISKKYLQSLIESIEKGSKFMHSLSNLKNIPSIKKVFDLNHLIISIRDLIEEIAGDKIKIEFSLTNEVPLISADPFQIKEVVVELVQNAKNSIIEKGIIVISTEKLMINDESKVLLSISDTGEGMDEETIKKCFEPLFSTHPLRFGLGLSVIKNIIDKNDGTIELNSIPRVGTTVKILFPETTLPQAQDT